MPPPPTASSSGTKKRKESSAAPKGRKHRKTNKLTTGTTHVLAGLGLLLSNIENIQNMLIHDNAEKRRRHFSNVVSDFSRNMGELDGISPRIRAQRANYEASFRAEINAIKTYLEGRGFSKFNMNTHEYTNVEIESIIEENGVATSESIRPHSTNTTNPPTALTKEETSSTDHGARTGSMVARPHKTSRSTHPSSTKATNHPVVSAEAGSWSFDDKDIMGIDSGAPTLVKNILDIVAKIKLNIGEDQKNFQRKCEMVKKEFADGLKRVLPLKGKRKVKGYELGTDARMELEICIHRENRELSKVRRKYAAIFYDFVIRLEEASFPEQSKASLKDQVYTADHITDLLSNMNVVEAFKKACVQTSLDPPSTQAHNAFRLTGHRKTKVKKKKLPEDKHKPTEDA